MRASLEAMLRVADVPNPERAEALWAEYRAGGTGADAAFATLLAWYGLALYRHVWGFVRSDAADDVFQDVLAKWHRSRSRLATFEEALRWVRTVAVRQCVDARRRAARRLARERRVSRPEGQPPADGPELREELAVALSKLSREQREAVALVFFEGLDRQVAARVLGIHRDTLSARLDAALGRLQKLVSAPAVVASAGAAGVCGALSARPIGPSVVRLGELAERALATAAGRVSRLGRVAAAFAVLAGAAGITLAAWPRPEPPAPVADTRQSADPVKEETLQAKNVRLARELVVPLVIPQLESLLPKNNSVELVDVRGFGSKVECEFRTTRPLLGKKPAAVRYRYCVLRRWVEADSDLSGTGNWKRIDPDRPIVISIDIPGLIYKDAAIGRGQAAAIRQAFDQLPGDERAERESIAYWFGSPHPPPGELFFPSSWRRLVGNSRDLFFHAADEGLYVLRNGQWQYGGYCPGWLAAADETHLYRWDGTKILARRIDPRDSPWVRVGDLSGLKTVRPSELRAGAGRLIVTTLDAAVWLRGLAEADDSWSQQPWPAPSTPVEVLGDRLLVVRDRALIARPVGGGPWTPVGPMPDEWVARQGSVLSITAWQDRVLAWDMAGGPIYARTLHPNDSWQVIGRVGSRPTR